MKGFLLLVFAFLVNIALAQNNKCVPTEIDTLTHVPIFRVAEKMPSVEGGNAAIVKAILSKIKYPDSQRSSTDTKIIIAFIIDSNGDVVGERTIKNIDQTDIAEQLFKIIREMKWQPGTCEGNPVPVLQIFPLILEIG
jgi:protein TonB